MRRKMSSQCEDKKAYCRYGKSEMHAHCGEDEEKNMKNVPPFPKATFFWFVSWLLVQVK